MNKNGKRNHTCCCHGEHSITKNPPRLSSPGVVKNSAAHPFPWSFVHHKRMLSISFGDKKDDLLFLRRMALKMSWPVTLMANGSVSISAVI
jgi:hypothetical protein